MADRVTIDTSVLDRFLAQANGGFDTIVGILANLIVAEIVSSFNTSPPGRAYTRKGVTHVASVGGYPPNIDTGALAASITPEKVRDAYWVVKDQVEYGIYLEQGTASDGGAGGMAPRPFMEPAFENMRAMIVDIVAEEMQKWY